ncbi:MAG: DUF58 domain-containing protein [Pseudomonadota bacterium]
MSLFKRHFHRWAAKRSPRSAQVILRHKTIYIFPGKQGLAFLLVILLIWLLGTNYQNNLILAFSFFLISVMLVSTIHAFKNMLGVTFSPAAIHYAAVGDVAPFDIMVRSQYHTNHNAILLILENSEPAQIHLLAGKTDQITLGLVAQNRGWLKLPRITIKSYFPFGFIRAWAYVDIDHQALIYPRSIACDRPPLGAGQGYEGQYYSHQRGDEFQGFQTYYPGSPLSQVAWKQYARGAGMHLKDYRAHQSQQSWLDWHQLNVGDTELGLSYMSYWVNQFSENNIEFGLILPNKIIESGTGEAHRLQALTALALFGLAVDE